jgi:hypothetical protein
MWKNNVEPDTPQTTIRRMRIACWIPKSTITHLEYVIFMAFPLHHWLHERASVVRYTYIACLATLETPMYSAPIENEQTLHQRILYACHNIRNRPLSFDGVRRSVISRVNAFSDSGGGHCEGLL